MYRTWSFQGGGSASRNPTRFQNSSFRQSSATSGQRPAPILAQSSSRSNCRSKTANRCSSQIGDRSMASLTDVNASL